MIRMMACILLLQVLVVACGRGNQNVEDNEAQRELDALAKRVYRNEIETLEIMHLPSSIETRGRVAPEMLEKIFMYRLTIRYFEGGRYARELAEVLKSTSVQPRAETGDIRWALIFYDSTQTRVGAIYVSGFGDSGAVGDIPVSFKGRLFRWLKKSFSGCFR